jgi:UDP-glucose 4-epimerase
MDTHGAYTEVLIRWMERIQFGRSPLIFGDGLQTMDFVHVEDIARANVMAAKSDRTDRVYNIASGTETSLNDLAAKLLRVMGSEASVEYGPERRVNPVPRRLADTRLAEAELGFKTRVALDEGLRSLVAWWRQQRGAAMEA